LAQDKNLTKLKHIALSGDLKVSKFRSICWNLLLGVLKDTPDKWLNQRREQRQNYKEIKTKYNFNPHSEKRLEEKENLDHDNPLSQENSSTWNQHFRDQELCSLIRQDVVRTNPTVDFYHKENIQEIMVSFTFH
jgi:TBC1 domain family protein 5